MTLDKANSVFSGTDKYYQQFLHNRSKINSWNRTGQLSIYQAVWIPKTGHVYQWRTDCKLIPETGRGNYLYDQMIFLRDWILKSISLQRLNSKKHLLQGFILKIVFFHRFSKKHLFYPKICPSIFSRHLPVLLGFSIAQGYSMFDETNSPPKQLTYN